MSFENEVFKEPETVPMNEVHKNPETRANLPDDEDFDVDAEGTEEEIALSPADQDVYDYVMSGIDKRGKEDFSNVEIDNPEGLLTNIGKKFGGMKTRLMLISALLVGGAAAGKVNAQDNPFDELNNRVAVEKAEGKSGGSIDEQYKQLREDITKQEQNMKKVFGPNVDLSGGAAKTEKQEKINIDFDKFFHSQFPGAKEIKVIKQGGDFVANIDGKIYVGSASTGAEDDLARQKAEISADGARTNFLAGNFGKTESFSHANISGGGAPIEKRAEGKDGYTYFVFYQMSE